MLKFLQENWWMFCWVEVMGLRLLKKIYFRLNLKKIIYSEKRLLKYA